jgi:parallel beta-helix repeat protein
MNPKSRRPALESLESREMLTVFTVTSAGDTGAGTLRDALTRSNNTAGVDTIAFNLPAGQQVIRPASPLPELWDPTVLDGATQSGYAGKPLVQIDGANAGAGATGLKLWGNSTVRGLSVTNFTGDGVALLNRGGLAGNTVQGMWIGLDLAGAAAGNAGQGVMVWKSPSNLIGGPNATDRNVISAAKTKSTLGVLIQGAAATNNVVQNNYIGTDPTGTQARANAGSGVGIQDAPGNLVVGNVISGNVEDGILIFKSLATGNVVRGNLIGVDASGTRRLANGFHGIEIQAADNTIGGPATADRNVISGNAKDGIVLWTTPATANTIRGNFIGTDVTGNAAIGNGEQGIAVSNANANEIAGNLISGNTLEGVGIFPGSNNTVTGNTIGFAASGAAPLPNGTWAVTLVGGSNGNVVTGNYLVPHPSGLFLNSGVNTVAGNYASASTPLPGDANGDCVVNFDDLIILAKNYNATGMSWSQGDFTGDGVVNFDDLLVLSKNYNRTAPAPAPLVEAAPLQAPVSAALSPVARQTSPSQARRPVFATRRVTSPRVLPHR